MEQNRCPGCMNIKSGMVCEHCGFDERRQNAPHQLQIGTVLLGKYLVGRALGQGGFGITYLGWNRYLETKVAIKEYYPSVFVDRNTTQNTSVVCKTERMEEFFKENRMRFLREAQSLAKLQRVPQIVSIYDFFEVNNTAYIVMEYLQGDNLRDYLRKKGGRLPAAETFGIMRPVMAALAEIHEAGMVHRDISPDNIMLQYDGSVKLMDFGAVRSVNNPDVDKELTQATQAIVKHGFAPVEQYSATGSIGPWTDEYALCATMYYCMTGKVPKNAPDRIQDDTELEWDTIAGLTEQQKKILCKGTAVRAKDRYASIRELMDALFTQPKMTDAEQEAAKREAERLTAERYAAEKLAAEKAEAEKRAAARQEAARQVAAQQAAAQQAVQNQTSTKLHTAPQQEAKDYTAYYLLGGIGLLFGILCLVAEAIFFGLVLIMGGIFAFGKVWIEGSGNKTGSWREYGGNRYYYNHKGNAMTGWQSIDGEKYYFAPTGIMEIGSRSADGNKTYYDRSGKQMCGLWEIESSTYYFDHNGKMATAWQEIDGNKHYFYQNGTMVTGWETIGGKKYHFDSNGRMVTGWKIVEGSSYYFGDDGKMVTGWKEIEGARYYFDRKGLKMTGWQTIDGVQYCFDGAGRLATGWQMISGSRYYFEPNGKKASGWKEIDGDKYYFDSNGAAVTGSREINGRYCTFGTDGRFIH
ncbi:MAG: protein kinase [Oscillospiraceae bacterium]|nr:protein kinase [Oscillospiraceae bacterium]